MNAARLALTLAALAALCGCATRRSPATPMAAVRAQAATATAVTATVKARAAVAQAQAAVAKIQPPADAAQAAALEEVRFALSAAAVHLDTVRDAVTTANTAANSRRAFTSICFALHPCRPCLFFFRRFFALIVFGLLFGLVSFERLIALILFFRGRVNLCRFVLFDGFGVCFFSPRTLMKSYPGNFQAPGVFLFGGSVFYRPVSFDGFGLLFFCAVFLNVRALNGWKFPGQIIFQIFTRVL